MSKAKAKAAIILIIDIGENVCEKGQDVQTFLQKSKLCASRIVERKIFSDSKDELGVIVMGSETTNNDLSYSNIDMKDKWLMIPNLDMIRYIDKLTLSSEPSDWLDGLVVAINLLKDESEVKKFTELKVIMFSNFSAPIKSVKDVDDIIESLLNLKINTVAICPHTDSQDEDSISENHTESESKGLAVLGKIVDESGGLMCTVEEAMSHMGQPQKPIGKAQAWNCDLKIGSNIYIPITGYKKFAPKPFIKWSKKSVGNTPVVKEFVYFQGDEQVDKSDVIKSFLFGRTLVPISDEDKASIKLKTDRSFQLLGFSPKKDTPCHMFLNGSAHYITPRSGNEGANEAITALVKALMELEMVGIVRKVYCKNASPRLGAIIPTSEQGSYFFYFVPLPYDEDVRSLNLPSSKKIKPSQLQLDAVDKLIDDMDLSQYEEDEDPYSKLYNPSQEKISKSIVFKALNPKAPLPDLSEHLSDLLQPKPEILENASEALENIKNLFPLEEVEQKKYRRGAADVFDKSGNLPLNGDVKQENLLDTITNFVQSSVTEVGTIDPEGNFIKLLELGEPSKKVCEQMQTAIKKLLLTSNGSAGLQKPLSAIKTLRKHCITSEPSMFNDFIAVLKDDLVDGNSEFWSLIVQDKLGLISDEESENSKITLEEADLFYHVKKCETQTEENYEMEAEDMLDML